MVTARKIIQGVNTDYRTPFEHWVEDELNLEIVRGYAAGPLGKLPLRPWKGRNLDAVFLDIFGCESLAGMYIAEIPPGQSTVRQHQLYEETFYVHKGNGSTTIETPQGTISFEWGARSLFAIPLNCPYQLHNGSGTTAARVISCSTMPIIFSFYRDPKFIFGTDFDFARVDPTLDPSDATLYKPDAKHNRTAVDLYDTLFVPDILALTRTDFSERGTGASAVYIEMAQSAISNHISEVPGRRFFNPHRHGPSAFVFTLTGSGYSLMWPHDGEMVRFDWPENDIGVIVPPNMWWHGHFATSPNALQLAIKLRSRFNPINHLYDKSHKPVTEGGTVLRFQDLDEKLRARIWDTFVEECAKKGFRVTPPEKVNAA